MAQRVALFIDYQNVYKAARALYSSPDAPHMEGQVRPNAIASLVRNGRDMNYVHVYRGMPSGEHDPKAFGACQRQVAKWTTTNVHVTTRPLNYRDREAPREKGIDVHLAVDYVMMAMRNQYDVGVLFSADTDLLPAAEAVLELKGPGSVEFVAWRPIDGSANRLRCNDRNGNEVWCHLLSAHHYRLAHDPTDYLRKPPRRRSKGQTPSILRRA